MNFKDDLLECECLCCNKSYQEKFDENLKKRFFNTYKFSNHSSNKFLFLLQNGVFPYEYIDDWEKFNETTLPKQKYFYSRLKMQNVTDADYTHTKELVKILKQKFRRISWSVCSKRYTIISWCIWKFLKYVSWNIWTWSPGLAW